MLVRTLAFLIAVAACQKAAGPPVVTIPDPKNPPFTDGGPPDAGPPDAGPPDAGPPDAGPPDAGPPDAGPDPHRIGGLGPGPFPKDPLTIYGSAQGLMEAPISASVDEGENLWVVTESALYLLAPGARVFRRYTARDGLHYGPGYTEPPDITLVEGGVPGECFVGYTARDTNSSMFKDAHMWTDPWAHMGKMDQVLLQPDGSLKVNRYDLRNSNDGRYFETRTVTSMWRKAFGILSGVAVGFAFITLAEAIEGLLHPLPPSVNPANVESYRVYIARLPTSAFVVVLCGHALGSLSGGTVATLVARRASLRPAIAVGVVLLLGGLINVIALPHPAWFIGLDLACYIPLAWLGARLAMARAQPASGAGAAGT